MSLINPRNFMAPLTNVVNLATIIVIALLFGIYRLSGGGVSISNRKVIAPVAKTEAAKPAAPSLRDVDTNDLDQVLANAPKSAQPARPAADNAELGALLSNNAKKPSLREQPKKPGEASKSGNSLDDIARQLGVE